MNIKSNLKSFLNPLQDVLCVSLVWMITQLLLPMWKDYAHTLQLTINEGALSQHAVFDIWPYFSKLLDTSNNQLKPTIDSMKYRINWAWINTDWYEMSLQGGNLLKYFSCWFRKNLSLYLGSIVVTTINSLHASTSANLCFSKLNNLGFVVWIPESLWCLRLYRAK